MFDGVVSKAKKYHPVDEKKAEKDVKQHNLFPRLIHPNADKIRYFGSRHISREITFPIARNFISLGGSFLHNNYSATIHIVV